MSGDDPDRGRDPRLRPPDPAGTRPKHDPAALLPQQREPLIAPVPLPQPPVGVEGDADAQAGEPSLLPARRAAAASPGPLSPPSTSWTPRFQFLLGALVAIGVAALAALVVIALEPEERAGPQAPWSTWAPSDDGQAGAQQIAAHVGPAYHLADGRQLVLVTASALEIDGIPLDVAVRETAEQGGQIRTFDDGGLIYRLCGLGEECAIVGPASRERHVLLRREALELALYSFRYLSPKSVVVLLPPAPGQKASQALFFRADDVAPLLRRPLSASLTSRPPSPATIALSKDLRLVLAQTAPQLFTFTLTPSNTENRGYLVLEPLTAEALSGGSSDATTTTTTPATTAPDTATTPSEGSDQTDASGFPVA